MYPFIERMKARSEEERQAIAVGAAIGVVVLLFTIWGVSFFAGISATSAPQVAHTPKDTVEVAAASSAFTSAFNAAVEKATERLEDSFTREIQYIK